MEYKGSLAYDDKDFLDKYLNRRSRVDSPNNAIEGPIINELLGNVVAADLLDLGCGDGQFGKELLNKGATTYTGIEGSFAMSQLAKQYTIGLKAKIVHSSMEDFHFPEQQYDIVLSRMAIHYVEDLKILFFAINKAIKKNGLFIFSIQHPLTTSSFESKSGNERKENWIVDDYFQQGIRKEPWLDKTIIKYHRTIEYYFNELISAGFHIKSLKEGEPQDIHFADKDEFERRKRIPVILVFSCMKTD